MFLAVLVTGISALATGPADALSEPDARNLVSRTGFGVRKSDLKPLESQSFDRGVDGVVAAAGRDQVAVTPPPEWVNAPLPSRGRFKDAGLDEKKKIIRHFVEQGFEL